MNFFLYHSHQDTERVKIFSFGIEFEFMFLEEWNDYFQKITTIIDLVSVAILMIEACIFLKIHTSTSEKLFQRVQDILIFLDKFDVKLRLNDYSSPHLCFFINISYIDSEASFTIHEAHNIIRV